MGKIASLQAQNKKLLLEKNNFMADNKILETEMEMTQKTNRSYHILIFLYRNTCISKTTAEISVKTLSDIPQYVVSTYYRKNMFPKHIFVTSKGLVVK